MRRRKLEQLSDTNESPLSALVRSGGRKRVTNRKAGPFKVWQNAAGEWCLGNKCFSMTAKKDRVDLRFNTQSKNCPANLSEAAKELMKIVEGGGVAQFIVPKPPPEGQDF